MVKHYYRFEVHESGYAERAYFRTNDIAIKEFDCDTDNSRDTGRWMRDNFGDKIADAYCGDDITIFYITKKKYIEMFNKFGK